MRFPFKDLGTKIDLTAFRKYLDGTDMKDVSKKFVVRGVRDFASLFVVSGTDQPDILFSRIFHSDAIGEIFSLPVLDARYGWTCNMMDSLQHLYEHLKIQAYRRKDCEAARSLELLYSHYVKPKKRQANKQKFAKEIDVEERDSDKMEAMMTIPQMREAIKQSMVNLCAVDYAMRENSLTEKCNWPYCATVNMAGIVFFNSQAGRTHEWYKLKKSTVQKFYVIPHILNMCIVLLFNCIDCPQCTCACVCARCRHDRKMIAEGGEWFSCADHKTKSTYGRIGKYVPPGTQRAMQARTSSWKLDFAICV